MSPEEEIDFWRECYNGEHSSPENCPSWYDWCNCGGTMANEIEYLGGVKKGMMEDIATLKHTVSELTTENEELRSRIK